jgi:hypothetical protein
VAPKALSEFMSAEALAQAFGVEKGVVMRWIDKGLPYIRVDQRRVFFLEASVAVWLKGRERTDIEK